VVQNISFEECEEAGLEWLKSYRVEDAERKEFLYPENWLDPGGLKPFRFRLQLSGNSEYCGKIQESPP
jgi:hypothetical protein